MLKKIGRYLCTMLLLVAPAAMASFSSQPSNIVDVVATDHCNVSSVDGFVNDTLLKSEENETLVIEPKSKAKTMADLENGNIGVLTGSNHNDHVKNRLPNAELSYFNTLSDMVAALQSRKIDAFASDDPSGRNAMAQHRDIAMLPEMLENLDYAAVFPKSVKGGELCDQFSDFVTSLNENGTLKTLQSKWFDASDLSRKEMMDYTALPSTNGTLRLGTFQNPPFAFTSANLSAAGYDVEIVALFCEEKGYSLETIDYSLDAILASVINENVDMAVAGFSVTEERKESIHFSTPTYSGGTALLVLDDSYVPAEGDNFFTMIAEGFEKTFIREDRWRLFVSGIITTLIITVLSIIFGTALGFAVFLACRRGNKDANGIARFFVWLVQGMPAVVLIMILYYIVFRGVPIAGEAISIIGFTLIFGSAVFNMLKAGVATVDKGQTEAAFALGYRDSKAFFRIILPQALPHMLPTYRGEITSLIKATAIVGYVAVQDVTKIGDIIRSRTFEPFFPLITVAILYFVLAGILIFIVSRLGRLIDPKRRKKKKLLKGVQQR